MSSPKRTGRALLPRVPFSSLLAAMCVGAATGFGAVVPVLGAAAPAPGTVIAPFSLVRKGGPLGIGEWGKRRASVLVFMGNRCPVSNAYAPRLATLARQYAGRGVAFYGIDANAGDSAAAIAEHVRAQRLPFQVGRDSGAREADRLDAQVTPEVFVVDRAGRLAYHGSVDNNIDGAAATQHGLADALRAITSGRPVAVRATQAFGCSIKRGEGS